MRPVQMFIGLCLLPAAAAPVLAQPTAEQIFKMYVPVQKGVEFDTPEADKFKDCKVEIERGEGTAGFVVYGPAGEVLRRFTDTNKDTQADLYRYYRMGLEVYRDIDTDFNQKPDQHRWMNWGGMRWGIDKNEDGKIDQWRILSAQEAAQIAVEAMINGDVQALASVLLTAEDVKALKVTPELEKKLLDAVSDPGAKVRQVLSASKTLTSRSKWVRFDPPVPGLIPRDDGKSDIDLTVYENAMAIVENGTSHELVSIGEMIQVGNVWKLAQIPMPLDAENAHVSIGGIMMQPQMSAGGFDAPPEMAKELEAVLNDLQKLDESSPEDNVTPQLLAKYNRQRADLIEKVIRIVPNEKERIQWIKQLTDGIGVAVQTGQYDDGLKRLTQLQDQVKANNELLGYVWYRRLLAEYAVRLKEDNEKSRQTTQDWWLKQLEVFAEKWPQSDDTADAIVQLAISLELMGRVDDAKRWYGVLVKDHERTNAGIRAGGALRRLDLAGKPLQLAGRSLDGNKIDASQYRGKVTLVVFWATWAQPYTDDLPKLVAVHKQYQRAGFEILGVNLDADAQGIPAYLARNGGGNWQHIRDPGGTDGQLARSFGIVSVPTMFIVGKDGRVAGGVAAESLETAVQTLLKGQALDAPARQGAAGLAPDRQ
ncbi:TlpA disulfide reductase family protein [Fuerstiella marisgermanici]|uniref:Thiol-disulfide oxidoreductase ResA n=1 Tax=Fuerstiella marisgermanici TaxID=1891926 RepID=A0A1P8WHF7_9PLAN|nr:TlpA disulfide reductase family protein [Fuerstiella marisgermanici]APZ93473.1 Thiol-disulfide oxidoreductase ResA [Fuerstiella marisgermanici]